MAVQHVKIREAGEADREALLRMYRGFEPLGVAQGLPPLGESGRREWIGRILQAGLNLVAVSPNQEVLGHSILAGSGPDEAEIAFFVHQDHRKKRLGTRLVRATLAKSEAMHLRRIWASVLADNVPALRLLRGRGFTVCYQSYPSIEMELWLPQPASASVR